MAILSPVVVDAVAPERATDLRRYFPQAGEVGAWKPSDTAGIFAGDDLYLLIDGGADIYHEYGFRQVAARDYADGQGRSITVELYEMTGPAAAYGMYSFKTNDEGKPIRAGHDARLSEYYLNFWKGRFLATLIGFDSSTVTIAGLLALAKALDDKIIDTGSRPALAGLVRLNGYPAPRIIYLMGNLALDNFYKFGPQNVFGPAEGVLGKFNDFDLLLFKYGSPEEGRKRWQEALGKLRQNPDFSNKAVGDPKSGAGFSMTDPKGRFYLLEIIGDCVVIFIGIDRTKAASIQKELRDRLAPDR